MIEECFIILRDWMSSIYRFEKLYITNHDSRVKVITGKVKLLQTCPKLKTYQTVRHDRTCCYDQQTQISNRKQNNTHSFGINESPDRFV